MFLLFAMSLQLLNISFTCRFKVELPKRNVETVEVSLEGPERQAYDTMMECAE